MHPSQTRGGHLWDTAIRQHRPASIPPGRIRRGSGTTRSAARTITRRQGIAAAVLAAMPSLAVTARLTRRFQADAVRRLLDLGVRHPLVLTHARALLRSSPEGACTFLSADIREPGKILAHAAETIDLEQPTAIFALMILHFIPDDGNPWGIVRRLVEGIRGDGYLVIGHAGADIESESSAAAGEEYNARSPVPVRLRTHEEVARFFSESETDLIEPGLLSLADWWPDQDRVSGINGHVGMGWRPASDSTH